jgi:2-dehydropantoate 2-reductase
MRQPTYLLIGSGRLARHLAHYFSIEGLAFKRWSRQPLREFNSAPLNLDSDQRLQEALVDCTHVLLLIRDDAIHDFVKQYRPLLSDRSLIHCSGALSLAGINSAHPLASFAQDLFGREFYSRVPFVTESGQLSFVEMFPQLHNPSVAISSEQKAFYHSLCVVAGNFTNILWAETQQRFESRLGIQKTWLLPYMESIIENLKRDVAGSLTGPLARGDHATIQKNLQALDGDDLELIYRAFVKFKGL